jgi:SAM-dependent methyltransferase
MSHNHAAAVNIVAYWNKELLCSLVSSTSHADPDLACLDNAVENHVLRKILTCWNTENPERCLDVGAGYGRFTPTFQRFYAEIVLLEAAERIYDQLRTLWQHHESTKCYQSLFESFHDDREYDLVFSSGVVYLYDDQMLQQFMAKAASLLRRGGLLILRDFVADSLRIIKSNYVPGGHCHYRTPQFWRDFSKASGFEFLDIQRSKPRLALLRSRCLLSVLRRLHMSRWLRGRIVAAVAQRAGSFTLRGEDIHPVFLVMRRS